MTHDEFTRWYTETAYAKEWKSVAARIDKAFYDGLCEAVEERKREHQPAHTRQEAPSLDVRLEGAYLRSVNW